MAYYNKFEKMKLTEIRKSIREMSEKVNDVIKGADEQTKDIFTKEYETLVRLSGGKSGKITSGSRLKKEEAIKFATELNRAIKLEEFTEKGGVEKQARIEKSWESFQENHSKENWSRKEWEEIGKLFSNVESNIKGHLPSDDIVDILKIGIRKKGIKGETLAEMVKKEYKEGMTPSEVIKIIRKKVTGTSKARKSKK